MYLLNIYMALAFAVIAAAAVPPSKRSPGNLEVKISGPATVHGIDKLDVTVSVKNTRKESVKILVDPTSCLWTKPATEVFAVEGPNGPADFDGVRLRTSSIEDMAKDAGDGDVVVIPGGKTHTMTHRLGNVYDLTKSGPGKYKVHVARRSFYVFEGKGKAVKEEEFESPLYEFTMTGALISAKLKQAEEKAEKEVKMLKQRDNLRTRHCNAEQQNVLRAATPEGDKIANEAHDYLKPLKQSTPRWKFWFGDFNEDDRADVTGVYYRMTNLVNFQESFLYDCGECKDLKLFAYVYPKQMDTIYLCEQFWKAALRGRHSQAGTLVHEASHFERIGMTVDYGKLKDAPKLASSNPLNKLLYWNKKASMNAENYAGFAENDPHLD